MLIDTRRVDGTGGYFAVQPTPGEVFNPPTAFTVREMIAALRTMPEDAQVFYLEEHDGITYAAMVGIVEADEDGDVLLRKVGL